MLSYRLLPLSHRPAKVFHAAMHTVTLVLISLALWAVIHFHSANHYPHLSVTQAKTDHTQLPSKA